MSATRQEKHPLLQEQYDIFLCSHALEHLPSPAAFLRRIRSCLKLGGCFVGLVPINERRDNSHHVRVCERAKIGSWLAAAGLTCDTYVESDPWLYWIQPLFTSDTGARHRLAQVLSLALGVPSTLLGRRAREVLAPWCARLTGAKPTQRPSWPDAVISGGARRNAQPAYRRPTVPNQESVSVHGRNLAAS